MLLIVLIFVEFTDIAGHFVANNDQQRFAIVFSKEKPFEFWQIWKEINVELLKIRLSI